MPKRDGTGPQGKGAQTGAKMGACNGSQNVPFNQGMSTRGCGQKRGMGNRWKHLNQQSGSSEKTE